MELLREQPVVSLAGPGQAQTFIADIFQPRPAFDEIARFSEAWSTEAAEKMQQAMKRKNCPVTWVQLVIDQHGLLAILRFQHALQLCDAKKAAKVVLGCLPDKQRLAAEHSLRPLDEVDRNRLAAWQTVASLRPAGKKKRPRDQDESDEEEYQSLAKRAKTVESNAKSAAELLAELSDGSSGEEEEVAPPRLMLTNGSSAAQEQIMPPRGAPSALAVPSILDPTAVWEYRARRESVIIVAEVGERPEWLAYVHCHRESRRQLLLQSRVREEYESPGMPQVVRVAMQLAADGSMPGPGEHGRKNEFIKRCAAALRVLDPSKETDLKKLGAQDQALVRKALGGDISTPYEGCLSEDCLDKKTIWETSNGALPGEPFMPMSRCARCKYLNVFGRSVNSVRDILRKTMEVERGRMTPMQLGLREMGV